MVDPTGGAGSEEAPPGQEPPKPGDAASDMEELKKQMADVVAANKKLTADLEVSREENARTQELVRSMSETPGGPTPSGASRTPARGSGRFADPAYRSEFEQKYSIPADAAEEIANEAVSRLAQAQQEREQNLRQAEGLKKTFFDAHPDLSDYLPIVRHYADEVTREHPNWTVKEGFAECAKRSREYIKSKLGTPTSGGEPPSVIPGGSHRSEGGSGAGRSTPDAPPTLPSQNDEIAAELAERRKNRSSAL